MPVKRSWGIKPGGGKKANEFDDLDVEDKQIAEAEEKKAQDGIAPGSDHPMVVSHKSEAIKASKKKASLDMVFGEAREVAEQKLREEEDIFDENHEMKLSEAKWPGMDIKIDPEEITWFQETFRLKPFAKAVDTPVAELGVLYDPTAVKKELQAIYHAKHDMIGKSELERRDLIIEHYEEYAAAMASTKARPPRHFVKTDMLPLIRRLTARELKDLKEKHRMEQITSKHPHFSPPFRAMRDYLIFLGVFLGFLYCGFSTDKLEIREKLTNQLNSGTAFSSVTSTSKLQTWIDDVFMDVFYPETAPTGKDLTCQGKQYLNDGVNLRIGNVRVRQIRVGKDDVKGPWAQDKVDDYATCTVPDIFKPSIGRRCFRTWGGQSFPVEQTMKYKGLKWRDAEQLDTNEYYSVLSRLQWPGNGYTKLIANERTLAQEDFNALFEHTFIDIQTRALFIEATLLNVPTSFITVVRLLVQYGAEGEILATVDADVAGTYRYARVLEMAFDRYFSNDTILAVGVICFVIFFFFSGYISYIVLDVPVLLSFVIGAIVGFCMMWWGMSTAYASIEGVNVEYFLMPGFELLVYSCVFFQIFIEYRIIKRGRASGDSLYALCFTDNYNMLHLINLGFWMCCFGFRMASFSALYDRLDDMEDAIVDPCFKTQVAYDYNNGIGNYSYGEASAWAAVPDGCYGKLEANTDDASSFVVNYGSCPDNASGRTSAECCAEGGFVSMFWPVEYDIWVQQLMAFNAFLLCIRFFKFVSMFNSLALFANTLKEAVVRVGHLAVIIMLIMTGFSVSFHLAFGYSDQKYRDFPEAVKTLFEIILGSFDLQSLREINPYLAPVFFYLYVLVIVMVLLSMFVAVVNNSYEGVLETMAEPEFCFFRDFLWKYCVDAEDKEPVNSQHELFRRMKLSKHFLRDPGTDTLSPGDRKQLKAAIATMTKYALGHGRTPEEGLPRYIYFRRPDGRSADGTPTDVLIRNTNLFRACLSEKCGADNYMMVNDMVHLYWSFLQIPPICWIIKWKSLPGKVFRYFLPTVEQFKKSFEIIDQASEEELDNDDGKNALKVEDGVTDAGNEEEDEDDDGTKKKYLSNEDDALLLKNGLSSQQIDLLHQLEEPKLSVLKGMSKAEEGQRRVLFAIDLLTRTAREYKAQIDSMQEAKEDASALEMKKQAQAQAEAEAKANRERDGDEN